MWQLLYKLASPKQFYRISGRLLPWFATLSASLLVLGLYLGLVAAPADYQQGEVYRIIYLHVPSAFFSLSVYGFISFCALLVLVWRIKLADVMVQAGAIIGAVLTAVALITGSIWGKPTWGAWWIWDARLTSELILFFIYVAILALRSTLQGKPYAAKICAVFVLVGAIDLPIIHYSVTWWQTLHQGSTLRLMGPSLIHASMLTPLLIMLVGVGAYVVTLLLSLARIELLKREQSSDWVKEVMR